MSYLIHNFAFNHYTLRLSWKARTVVAVRNASLVYFFLTTLTTPFNITASTWHFSQFYLKTYYHYFSRLFYVFFAKVKEIRFIPIGLNFPRSAHYTSLTQLESTLTPLLPVKTLLPLTKHRLLYPYPFGMALVLHWSSKNIFFDLVYRFFRMSLSLWYYWPTRYKTWVHYTYISPRLRTMWFLNRYYYRIYHV